MIKQPVIYEGTQQELIDAYKACTSKNHHYWEAEEVNLVRSAIKKHYVKEQEYRCCYCQREVLTGNGRVWDVDHIVPKSTHPNFLFEPLNLAISCIDCNQAKGDQNVLVGDSKVRYPCQSAAYKIVHPHFDDFELHIGILKERIYIPKTRKGENTIIICRLLRYAYEYNDWDGNLVDSPSLVQKFDEMMGASDERTTKSKITELFAIADIGCPKSPEEPPRMN